MPAASDTWRVFCFQKLLWALHDDVLGLSQNSFSLTFERLRVANTCQGLGGKAGAQGGECSSEALWVLPRTNFFDQMLSVFTTVLLAQCLSFTEFYVRLLTHCLSQELENPNNINAVYVIFQMLFFIRVCACLKKARLFISVFWWGVLRTIYRLEQRNRKTLLCKCTLRIMTDTLVLVCLKKVVGGQYNSAVVENFVIG